MTLTEPHKRVLHVVHVQYPASLTAKSVVKALNRWRMKERQVINLLNEMVKWGFIEYVSCQKTGTRLPEYRYRNK